MATSSTGVRRSLRENWGFWVFSAFSLLSLVKLLLQRVPGHYRIFTEAGRVLWAGANPYGVDLGTGVGYYFYSPACGMFFFRIFGLFPEKVGITLYMSLSWLVFVTGVIRFARAYLIAGGQMTEREDSRGLRPFQLANFFWVAIAAQMVGGLLASKVEIVIVGILLLVGAWIIEGRRQILSAALLAMTLNWKFQPLPVAGLLVLSGWMTRRDWKFPLLVLAFTAAWFLLPFAFIPFDSLRTAHESWITTFSAFVRESYLNFENLFAFAKNAFGLEPSYLTTQALSAATGIGLAGFLLRTLSVRRSTVIGVLLSLGLGSFFMSVFSPLGQNNALILFAPLLLASFLRMETSVGRDRIHWTWALFGVWVVMTFAYSDLVPRDLRDLFRFWNLKSVACTVLTAVLVKKVSRDFSIPIRHSHP